MSSASRPKLDLFSVATVRLVIRSRRIEQGLGARTGKMTAQLAAFLVAMAATVAADPQSTTARVIHYEYFDGKWPGLGIQVENKEGLIRVLFVYLFIAGC